MCAYLGGCADPVVRGLRASSRGPSPNKKGSAHPAVSNVRSCGAVDVARYYKSNHLHPTLWDGNVYRDVVLYMFVVQLRLHIPIVDISAREYSGCDQESNDQSRPDLCVSSRVCSSNHTPSDAALLHARQVVIARCNFGRNLQLAGWEEVPARGLPQSIRLKERP